MYSGPAARALLPGNVIEESGMADKNNYAGLNNYTTSKKRYTEALARHMLNTYQSTWAITESGTVGPVYHVPGVEQPFTSITIAGW